MNLTEAIAHLDPNVDEHWTLEGAPRLDFLSELVGSPVKRKDVTAAAPQLTRVTAPELEGGTAPVAPQPEEGAPELDDETVAAAQIAIERIADTVPETQEDLDDRLLSLPFPQVINDYRLLEATLEALGRRNIAAVRAKSKAEEDLKQLNAKIELAKRQLQKLERANPSLKQENGTPVQAYLAAQARSDAERARRIRRFHDAGVTPEAVAASLAGSPLDAALSAKPGRGRPTPKIPQRMASGA